MCIGNRSTLSLLLAACLLLISLLYFETVQAAPTPPSNNRSASFQLNSLVCNETAVDFEAGIPADWQVVDNTNGSGIIWGTTSDTACGVGNNTNGSGEAACADSDAPGPPPTAYDTELVSPPIDATGFVSITLNVAAAYSDLNTGNNDRFEIDVYDGTIWTTELSWDEDHLPQNINLDLSAYAGLPNIQIRFHYFGNGWDWYAQVDDVSLSCISIYQPTIVVAPSRLNSSQSPNSVVTETLTISNTGSADLTWDIAEDTSSRPPTQAHNAAFQLETSGMKNNIASIGTSPEPPQTDRTPQATNLTGRKVFHRFPHTRLNMTTLYDQTSNPDTTAVNSQTFETAYVTYDNQAADDFVIPAADGAWLINTIEVDGGYFNGFGPMPYVNIFFYDDNGGLPGTPVYTASGVVPTADISGQLLIDLPTTAHLPAGTYWLSVQADMDFNTGGQWAWQLRSVQANNSGTWVNPGNGFNTGCTTWGPLPTCIGSSPDLIFRLLGAVEETCDVPEELPWLAVSATNGTTISNTSTQLAVTFDASGMTPGIYTGTLCIDSNDLATPRVQVPITMAVCPAPTAVTDLIIYQTGNDIQLTWAATNADYYEVYRNQTNPYFTPDPAMLLTTTSLTSTIDIGVVGDTDSYYYTVLAVNSCANSALLSENSNYTAVFNYALEPGTAEQNRYNAIAMPIHAEASFSTQGLPFNSQGLLDYIGASASQVMMLNANTQGLDFWDGSLGFGIVEGVFTTTPFPLIVGNPYMILLDDTAPTSLTFVGDVPLPDSHTFTMVGGENDDCNYNEIAIPLDRMDLTNGVDLALSIGNVTQVTRLNASSQALDFWDLSLGFGIINGIFTTNPDDFHVELGHAYRVCVTEDGDGTIWP